MSDWIPLIGQIWTVHDAAVYIMNLIVAEHTLSVQEHLNIIACIRIIRDQLLIELDEIPEKIADKVMGTIEKVEFRLNQKLYTLQTDMTYTVKKIDAVDKYLREEVGARIVNLQANTDYIKDKVDAVASDVAALPAKVAEIVTSIIADVLRNFMERMDKNAEMLAEEIRQQTTIIQRGLDGLKVVIGDAVHDLSENIEEQITLQTTKMTAAINNQTTLVTAVLDKWREETDVSLKRMIAISEAILEKQAEFFVTFWADLEAFINKIMTVETNVLASQMVGVYQAQQEALGMLEELKRGAR